VWRWVDPLVRAGQRILDLGCGTGEDALHLMSAGADVCGIDASAEMVRVARSRGVEARRLPVEAISILNGKFDGAISNFGVLNCVRCLEPVAETLRNLIRPGGFLALCVMGPFCAWELYHFFRRRHFRKAFRRCLGPADHSSMGIYLTYPSMRRLRRAFAPAFELATWTGIGLGVPPSYVEGLSPRTVKRLAQIDLAMAHRPVLRAMADHRLALFTRL
jgi:SAM-dependent methyltransferase